MTGKSPSFSKINANEKALDPKATPPPWQLGQGKEVAKNVYGFSKTMLLCIDCGRWPLRCCDEKTRSLVLSERLAKRQLERGTRSREGFT